MFPGYASRLYNEMKALYKKKTSKIEPKPTNSDNGPETEPKPTESVGGEKTSESKSTENDNGKKKKKKNKVITIIDSARRKYSVFIGATVLAQTYNSKKVENSGYWITKQDWEEVGPDIVLKKCQNIMA